MLPIQSAENIAKTHEYQIVKPEEIKSISFGRFSIRKCDQDKYDNIFSKYSENKIIVKMLAPQRSTDSWLNNIKRLEEEVDELNHVKVLKSASTSLLIKDHPTELYRKIGFMLDRDECKIRAIYDADCLSERVDKNFRKVSWNTETKSYCLDNTKDSCEFDGDFLVNELFSDNFINIEHLIGSMKDKQKDIYNEIILDYSLKSIIGIIFTDINSENEIQSLEQYIQFCEQKLGKELPLFDYNNKTAELVAYSKST